MGFSKTPIDAPPLAVDRLRKRPLADYDNSDDEVPKLLEPQAKRVRFATTANGEVKTFQVPTEICLSDLENEELWWSRAERSKIAERNQELVKRFRQNHMDQVRHYLRVFRLCTETPSQSSSSHLEQATVHIPTHIRGLEWGIVPAAKAHRRTHSQIVVEAQQQIRGRLSAEMRSRILSMRAMRSSRPSRVMARLVADGDASLYLSDKDDDCSKPIKRSSCKMIPQW